MCSVLSKSFEQMESLVSASFVGGWGLGKLLALFGSVAIGLLMGKTRARRFTKPGLLLLIALLTFRLSVAWGQRPVIFQYGYDHSVDYPGDDLADYLSANIYGNNLSAGFDVYQISKIGANDMTCLGNMNVLDPQGSATSGNVSGKCLYKNKIGLTVQSCGNSSLVKSFSTMFQVWIGSFPDEVQQGTVQGLAFIIDSDSSTQGEGAGYLGWLNSTTNNGQAAGTNFAVEIDFFQDPLFQDPIDAHVGVNINGLKSVTTSAIVGLKELLNEMGNIRLSVWIEYDGSAQQLEVFVSYANATGLENSTLIIYTDDYGPSKPPEPILSTVVDLTDVFSCSGMFIGLSGSILDTLTSGNYTQYRIGPWTFNSDGSAPDLPRDASGDVILRVGWIERGWSSYILVYLFLALGIVLALVLLIPMCIFRRRFFRFFFNLMFIVKLLYLQDGRLSALAKKLEMDEGVLGRGPQHFRFRALSTATKGFSSTQLLGKGGFGSVYRGSLVLKGDKKPIEVAVKRISATSSQGAEEFLAEVKIIGQVRQRNLVQLLGWCHERAELLLVYQYMPNGSLDQHLYKKSTGDPTLTWARRLKIVSGVATALVYLHEEWEQRVIHRDVKSSNVMLDNNFNARLGDFGLARLSEHDNAPPSTFLAGTHGYIAPELNQTLKPTEKTDVYSFGILVLEVATGKQPLLCKKDRESFDEMLLVEWVWGLYSDDALLDAADSTLHDACDPGEMIMLLKIGLLCSHPNPDERPNMREVINIWKGSSPFPPLPRSRPTPVFASQSADESSVCLELNTDPNTDQKVDIMTSSVTTESGWVNESRAASITLSNSDDGDGAVKSHFRDGSEFSPREKNEGWKSGSPNPTLRYRPRGTTTSLPF